MDLVQVDTKTVPKIPPVLLEEFDRRTPLEGLCTRCHAEDVGGKGLKLESITQISGAALNLTSALFHQRQAEIVTPENLILIQLTEKSKRARRPVLARFSWKKGSFWVKPNKKGWVEFFLDEITHQGDLTVQPNTGHLDLKIQR